MTLQAVVIVAAVAAILLAFMIQLARWLDRREDSRRREQLVRERALIRAASEEDHNPGGPLTEKQAQKLFEMILQAAIRQKADAILIDAISGRPQVRLRLEGQFQELTGVGDMESYRRLVSQARRSAGLRGEPRFFSGRARLFPPPLPPWPSAKRRSSRRGRRVSFAFQEISRRNRAVRFDLESIPIPGSEALQDIPAPGAGQGKYAL